MYNEINYKKIIDLKQDLLYYEDDLTKGGEKVEQKKKRTSKKEIVKEIRESKLIFTRTGISSITPRVSLPTMWVKHMGLSVDDKDLELIYSPRTKKITIRKKGSEETTEKE